MHMPQVPLDSHSLVVCLQLEMLFATIAIGLSLPRRFILEYINFFIYYFYYSVCYY